MKNIVAGMRLDKFLADQLRDLSRSKIQNLIEEGKILVNLKKSKSSYVLNENDVITVKKLSPKKPKALAEDFNFEVLYEDKNCLVIDKPAGISVHPAEGDTKLSGTVMNAVLSEYAKNFDEDDLRAGIVHRLDKDTSGTLLVAKDKKAADFLKSQFKNRKVKKHYVALVYGKIPINEGIVDSPISRDQKNRKKMSVSSEGKKAITVFKVKKILGLKDKRFSLVDIDLKTGRTHQIRVHMAAIGYPVVGDKTYGNRQINTLFEKKFGLKRQFLHAEELIFQNTEGKNVKTKSPLAGDLDSVLKNLSLV